MAGPRHGATLLVVLLLPLLGYGAWAWHRQAAAQRPQLPVAFVHGDHQQVPCADCHHNFIDGTGGGPCYSCHKLTPDIAADMEATFHDFCRDCHVRARLESRDSGPLRECSGCHQ